MATSLVSQQSRAPSAVRRWLAGEPLSARASFVWGLLLPAVLLVASMWRVREFTVDDSFIAFRYARNLADGLGLVYNPGQHVEGYTSFLFTVLLAGGIKVGIPVVALAKGLGASSALGALIVTHSLAGRLVPYRTLPCVATWLLASSAVFSGWAVYGLETDLFVFLILAGTTLFLSESPNESRAFPAFPWSGAVFALAGLTRPEAPMFFGVLVLSLGRRALSRPNLVRCALFCGPLILHLAFRRAYYGAWVPNTAAAKLGNLGAQIPAGAHYVQAYLAHAGPALYVGLLGVALALTSRRRDLLALTAMSAAVAAYVVLVGGDWMKWFRFLAPFEALAFLLVDVGARRVIDRREPATCLALALFAALAVVPARVSNLLDAQREALEVDRPFWDTAAGGTARWLLSHPRGEIAMGDIGYIGWATDDPVLDLLGLVDPVIAKLPGGYTQKVGPGFVARFFDEQPRYALIISSDGDCAHPSVIGSRVLFSDPRFATQYDVGGRVALDNGFGWCIYERRSP